MTGTMTKTIEPSDFSAQSAKPSLRVNVDLLDTLMNLAGELVLGRNQLLQGIGSSNMKATELSGQRIDMITSELQEAIMRTRMQPISNIFDKFTRIVRDLSKELDKKIQMDIEGKEVELDKTILEAISDPLIHLVRNCVEHGIETPGEREDSGKNITGHVRLKAFHDAGQVNILVTDDGRGLDPEKIAASAVAKKLISDDQVHQMTDKQKMELIFLPGFSTTREINDVSGRGAGMDVVLRNIEDLGGVIELESSLGKGTNVQIKLPLTLAIIPSQITAVGEERYAVPQVNLSELLRIPSSEVKDKIEKIGDSEVVRLRGELLPLVDLATILGIKKTYRDIHTDETKTCRRINIADRRSFQDQTEQGEICENEIERRAGYDRRCHEQSAVNIAVVSAGAYKYGLIVDQLHDSEEIVVKPVGRHIKKCTAYAGATIMGDGKVALILDIANIAQIAGLFSASEMNRNGQKRKHKKEDQNREIVSLITFKNRSNEYFAAPLRMVERIERIESKKIEYVGDRKVVQYRGGALPLYELSQVTDLAPLPDRENQEIIVFKVKKREIGLMVSAPIDVKQVVLNLDKNTLKQRAISGSTIIEEHTTLLVDVLELIQMMNPQWFK